MNVNLNVSRDLQAATLADAAQTTAAQTAAAEMSALIGAGANVTVTRATGATGAARTATVSVPELDAADEAKAAKADLEALIAYLKMETDEKTAETQSKRIDSLKGQLEAAHTSQMEKINKSIEEAKKQEAAAKAQKALSWLGAIFAVFVAVVVTVCTGGLAAGFAIAGAALAVSSAVLSTTGATAKIQKWMANTLQEMHPDWSKQDCQAWAQGIFGACELVLGLATSIGGGVSAARAAAQGAAGAVKISQTAAKVVRLAMNIGNGVMQTANLATTAASTATGYVAGRAQADATEAQEALVKLQKYLEESEDDLQQILEQLANAGSAVLELLESKTDTLNKISQEIGAQNA